ncbi:MAG: molybdopterin-dependent oxidoreductase [Mycobacteriales bacterium]
MRADVRRVQRPLDDLPPVHLEAEIPTATAAQWTLTVDGCVDVPQVLSIDTLFALGVDDVVQDFHCVWGWSRPDCVWTGVPGSAVAEAAGLREDFVVVSAAGGVYASALTIDEFRTGFFATHLDGNELAPESGGPLRFVQPPGKWAYKGVKWVVRVTGTPHFTPGFWETVVGNPVGDIPAERVDLTHER